MEEAPGYAVYVEDANGGKGATEGMVVTVRQT